MSTLFMQRRQQISSGKLEFMTQNIAGRANSSRNSALYEQISELTAENDRLAESFASMATAVLQFDEVGWGVLNNATEDGFTLEATKATAKSLRKQTTSNALLNRGAALRASYVFGRGFKMSSNNAPLKPAFKNIVDDTINQQVLFSEQALKRAEKTLFTDGNFFIRYSSKLKRFGVVSIDEISGTAADPDDPTIVQYYQRTYSVVKSIDKLGKPVMENKIVWYALDTTVNPVSKIGEYPVDKEYIMIDHRENNDKGIWGVPDCFSASPWAWSYSEYLKDGSKMLKALSSIAWHVKSKTAKGSTAAGSKLLNNRQVASTAVTGSDTELSQVPRSNAVDLGTGRPLAAMAATAMEVSVDALLAGSPSTASGAQVLDQSTLNAAYGRQGNWQAFFMRVLKAMGVPSPAVQFNKIIVDPSYRSVQSLGQMWQSGLFDSAVIQAAYAEEAGIDAPGAIPSGVVIPNNMTTSAAATNVATAQGNSGAGVGDLTNGNNQARDAAVTPR
jgi:hypothetical protein